MRSVFVSALLVGASTAVMLAQSPMRAGQWESSVQMQMPGMQMPEMKSTRCVTPEQLQQDPSSGLPSGMRSAKPDACKVSDYKVTGNTVSWKMACTDPQPVNGEGEMTFAGDAYTGTIKMMMPQGSMSMKVAGKRLGDCTK